MAGREGVLAGMSGAPGAPSGRVAAAAQPECARRVRVLDASTRAGRSTWLRVWRAWPDREPMAHPGYVSLFARDGDRAVAVLAEEGGSKILFPLVLRPISAEPWADAEDLWDASTPYGYGGPFTWGDGKGVPWFWRAYEVWCRRERVVSTFVRLSLFPEQLAPVDGRVEVRGPNVVVPLRDGIEAAWRAYDRDVRRRLRVSRKEGLAAEVDRTAARLAEFHAVYEHTMARRGAAPFYRFPRRFFERLIAELEGQALLVHAVRCGRALSSELVLASPRRAYAFLGGTWAEDFRFYPNELARHATAEWAALEGKEDYVLGGGRRADDGIYRHKRLLAPRGEVPFRTASLVHDDVAYHALARRRAAWEAARGTVWNPERSYFPIYRA